MEDSGVESLLAKMTLGAPFKDALESTRLATKDLKIGEFLSAPGFSLLEALSAIEIMDPKMDSGYLPPDIRPRYTVASVLGKVDSLTLSEVASILHRLLRCEATWLTGRTLAQTVFTSYLTHETDAITNSLLRTCLQALLKSIAITIDISCFNNVCHDEDLSRDMYGMKKTKQKRAVIIDELEKFVSSGLLAGSEDSEAKTFILNYIQFRVKYLLFLTIIDQQTYDLSSFEKLIVDLSLLVSKCTYAPGSDGDLFSFEIYARRLMTTYTPLPEIKILSEGESVSAFCKIFTDMKPLFGLPSATSLSLLLEYLTRITNIDIHVIARSALASYIVTPTKINMQDSVAFLKASFYMPPLKTAELSIQLTQLFEKCHELVMNTVRILLLNTCRTRRKLIKELMAWDALQADSEALDALMHEELALPATQAPYFLANWIYGQKLFLMESVLTLGFRIGLYGVDEIPSILWYVDFILGCRVSNLNRVRDCSKAKQSSKELREIHGREYHTLLKQELTRGIFRYIATIKKDDLYPTSPPEQAERRYLNRFKYFQVLGSPLCNSFKTYMDNSQVDVYDARALSEAATKSLTSAKTLASQLLEFFGKGETAMRMEIEEIGKVASANLISLKVYMVKRAEYLQKMEKIFVKAEYAYSSTYPTIRIHELN